MTTKTTMAKKETVERAWYHVDATGHTVGRLAARLSRILMGKHKPIYTPHVDCGDFVVVTNCEKVQFTGKKWTQKIYRHHSMYLGGLKEETAARLLRRHPDRILRLAVQRMLPKTKLGRKMIRKLKIYAGPEHPHSAQKPQDLRLEIGRRRSRAG